MAGFQYFVPDVTSVGKADLGRHGVAHAIDGPFVAHPVVGTGPAGGPGMLVVDSLRFPAELIGYRPDVQTWRQLPGSATWVGFYSDRRPTPDELVRPRVLPLNHPVRLADGNTWLCPAAIHRDERSEASKFDCSLPATARLDDSGRWVPGPIISHYAELWDIALRFWDAWIGAVPADAEEKDEAAESHSFTFDGLLDSACRAVAANYAIGPAELSLLEAIDEASAVEVLKALVDWPTVQKVLKKKLQSTAGT